MKASTYNNANEFSYSPWPSSVLLSFSTMSNYFVIKLQNYSLKKEKRERGRRGEPLEGNGSAVSGS